MRTKALAFAAACTVVLGCVWLATHPSSLGLSALAPGATVASASHAVHTDLAVWDRSSEMRSVGRPGHSLDERSARVEPSATTAALAQLSPEQRGRIEKSLDVLSHVESYASSHGDRELLARVELERGRLLKATTNVTDQKTETQANP